MFGRAEVREDIKKAQSAKLRVQCWVRAGGGDGGWVTVRLEGQTGVGPTGLS